MKLAWTILVGTKLSKGEKAPGEQKHMRGHSHTHELNTFRFLFESYLVLGLASRVPGTMRWDSC